MRTCNKLNSYIRLGTFGVGVVLVTAIVLTHTVPVDAEVAIYEPSFVERLVEQRDDEKSKTIQNLHTHTWSSFSGVVPEGSLVTDVSLVLTWSEVPPEEDVVGAVEMVPVVGTSTHDGSRGESATSAEIPASSTPPESVGRSGENTIDSGEERVSESVLKEDVSEHLSEPVLHDTPEAIPHEEGSPDTSAEAAVPDDDEGDEGEAVMDSEGGDDASVVGFMHAVPTRTYPLVNESFITDEPVPDDATQTSASSKAPVTEVSETFVVAPENELLDNNEEKSAVDSGVNGEYETPGVEELGERVDTPEVGGEARSTGITSPLYPTREAADVQYSFDGDSWTTLTAINLLGANEIELDMHMVSLESISSLRVRVVYLDPHDAIPLSFGNAQLKLSYTPAVVEVVLPGPSDQEPNFDSSFVWNDISSENIRAVLLERGGMLEFWYSVSNEQSGEVVWRKLSGGGAIEVGKPIAIKQRTIFWFDRNQETLLGFSVDSESVIGVSYTNPEERTFMLPFETENEELWQATYDLNDNLLKFERARNVSP